MTATVRCPDDDPRTRHRRASRTLRVRGADGIPLAGTEVTVEQVEHEVGLGCHGFEFVPAEGGPDPAPATGDGRAEQWLHLFNSATLPFYWGQFEPVPGRPSTDRLRSAARWLTDCGVRLKGHPLVWHTLAPDWLVGEAPEAVERAVRERIRREVAAFEGLVDTWDAVNEAVIMPVYDRDDNAVTPLSQQLGRVGIVRMAVEEARAVNPGARLLLNDFDMSPAYDQLVGEVLEAGVHLDALGLQSHMHQGWWGVERTTEVLERFARHGLPLHLTETTLVSGDLMPGHVDDLNDHQPEHWPSTPEGEARQAEEVEQHYRTLLASPAVASVTWWGLFDDGAWLGAPAGLVRHDGSPKPAYEALSRLVKGEWWVPATTVVTDEDACLVLEGWRGTYRVTGADGSSADVPLETAGRPGATLDAALVPAP